MREKMQFAADFFFVGNALLVLVELPGSFDTYVGYRQHWPDKGLTVAGATRDFLDNGFAVSLTLFNGIANHGEGNQQYQHQRTNGEQFVEQRTFHEILRLSSDQSILAKQGGKCVGAVWSLCGILVWSFSLER